MEDDDWIILAIVGWVCFCIGFLLSTGIYSSNAYDPLEELCDKAGYKFEEINSAFGKYSECWMLDDQGIITGECESKKVEGSYTLKCEIYVEER